jgi:TRAP-type mannitol/chloroaromatic compound transport system substrate-binding protein
MYVIGDFYKSLSTLEKKALEVAANASLSKSMSYRIYENGKALKDLTDNHGVILEDTPADYFTEYMAAAKKSLEAAAAENEFFAEVWQSQKDFADIVVPFWAGAQTSNASLGRAHADTLK